MSDFFPKTGGVSLQISQASTTEESSSGPLSSFDGDFLKGLFGQFMNLEGAAMLGCLFVLLIINIFSGKKKGLISSGRFAGTGDKVKSVNRALSQMKNPKRSKNALFSRTPKYWFGSKQFASFQTMLGSSPSQFFTDANQGMLVIGRPGSGKTFSVIDPCIESALVQGHSVCLYDAKGDQKDIHVPNALARGYRVEIFAPGQPYSGILNPLDFMRGPSDAAMASQIAKVIVENASGDSKGSDKFFEESGAMLVQALFQLAKGTKYPDLGMVYAIAKLDNLAERISLFAERVFEESVRMSEVNPESKHPMYWPANSFAQFLGMKDAEQTVAGVLSNAQSIFMQLIQEDLLPCLIGKSTIQPFIEGKQMIVFQIDDNRKAATGPLVAALIHMCVVNNLSGGDRQTPFLLALDEFPTLKFNEASEWFNKYRSKGVEAVVGIQSFNQIYNTYGKEGGQSIINGLSTHVLFNPGDNQTASDYSKQFGEVEVTVKNKSQGRTFSGGPGGISKNRNISENLQKKSLIAVDEILAMGTGDCVISSPGLNFRPLKGRIFIPKGDIKRRSEYEGYWEKLPNKNYGIREQYIERAKAHFTDPDTGEFVNFTRQLQLREEEARRLLPMSGEEISQEENKSKDEEVYSDEERVDALEEIDSVL